MTHLGPGAQSYPNPSLLKENSTEAAIKTTNTHTSTTHPHLMLYSFLLPFMADHVETCWLLSQHTAFFGRRKSQGVSPGEKKLRQKFMWVPRGHRTVNTGKGSAHSCCQPIPPGITALGRCPSGQKDPAEMHTVLIHASLFIYSLI